MRKIESFAYSQQGPDVLRENESAAKEYQASGSPTLVINGVKSKAIYQGEEAVKQAIDSAFTAG